MLNIKSIDDILSYISTYNDQANDQANDPPIISNYFMVAAKPVLNGKEIN